MSRLTARDEWGNAYTEIPLNNSCINNKHCFSGFIADKLAAYEDAEEQGLLVRLPCKVGDTVYVIARCENVAKGCDDEYFGGTGAITCPFEKSCDFEECDDINLRIFATIVLGIWIDEDGEMNYYFDDIVDCQFVLSDFGKTVFLTKEEAEKVLSDQKT